RHKVKSGISHARLRPTMAVIDPRLTRPMPPEVTAARGIDVPCQALEPYTAQPCHALARHRPAPRPARPGADPLPDAWAEQALGLLARSFRKAVLNGGDLQARTDMMLAATFAGMGFGNAGVHIPHACAYPLAGQVRSYRPGNYPQDEALLPHGESVSLTAPATFAYTFPTDPDRHLRAARMLDPIAPEPEEPAELLPSVLARLMRDIGIPNGIGGVGFEESDLSMLVEGTLKQERLLAIAPRRV